MRRTRARGPVARKAGRRPVCARFTHTFGRDMRKAAGGAKRRPWIKSRVILELELHALRRERQPAALLRTVKSDHYAFVVLHDRVARAAGNRNARFACC